jgi:uncharacterized protein YggU (UPF0235/DUF167 family)
MKIQVKVKPGAKHDRVLVPEPRLIKEEEEWYVVETKERPVEGRATEAVAKLLAEHFGVSRRQVRLVLGSTSKMKVFEIK